MAVDFKMPSSVGPTKCLAISFAKHTQTPSCAMNIFDLFMSFKYINITGQQNPWLAQAVQNCYLLGHFEPYVLLVGGSDYHLQIVKLSWMRTQLKSPFGFTIESISDAGGLLMQRVPQYRTMRLEEVICQLIWQHTQTEASCSMEQLMSALTKVYRDLQMRRPSYEAVKVALSALLSAGAVYFSGRGYSLLTADKLEVVKWLENVPEAASLSSDEAEQDCPTKAPIAELEPLSLQVEDSPHSWPAHRTTTSPTCGPYATSPVGSARMKNVDDQQTIYESASPKARSRQNNRVRLIKSIATPATSNAKGFLHQTEPWTASTYVSHPTLRYCPNDNVPHYDTPLSAPVPPINDSRITISSPDDRYYIARPDCSRKTIPNVPNLRFTSDVNDRCRSSSADQLQSTNRMNRRHEKIKPLQLPIIKWIAERFRRLRVTWRRADSSRTTIQKSYQSVCEPANSESIIQSHRKSHSIAIPNQSSGPSNSKPSYGPSSPPAAPPTCLATYDFKPKYSSLRRCFSLAEDADEGLTNRKPAPKLIGSFPSDTRVPEAPMKQLNNVNHELPIYQSMNLGRATQWFSHQNFVGSPSYLSLVARAHSQLDRTSVQQSRHPSHSTSRLAIPCSTEPSHPDWSYRSQHQIINPLSTPTNLKPSRKRPATRDSGFAESDCATQPVVAAQLRDRSVGYSVSPLSKSSDGGAFLNPDASSLWLNFPSNSPHVWWTTGFQNPAPRNVMASNSSVLVPTTHRYS
ncbi:hypothetical protein CSKR_107341 [Clonorchis sinensis]|uniref:Winged helix Storkhead-box1 domain-containing protein n=1 Tax=Clonorchis sinensis TaxID=79923 RepID=A0A8T1M788_CLOSI|nr:hypothetical protein CSKR_107341 [Clonorchis sinensis]